MTRVRGPAESANDEAAKRGTMRYWLAKELRELRKLTNNSLGDIAPLVEGQSPGRPIDVSSLSRFEKGESWPQQLDQVVAAYAEVCGVEDARTLWVNAATNFIEKGSLPVTRDLTLARRAARAALEALQRQRSYGAESPKAPNATRRRKAGG